MRKEEIIKKIGKENWPLFDKFMFGQTVQKYEDGSTNYYSWDVDIFMRKKNEMPLL